jgi:hypothetical protein
VTTYSLSTLPDVESALMFKLIPSFPSIRFVTELPAGDPDKMIVRINRSGGFDRRMVDEATVEIDLWGFRNETMDASIAAREIQANLLGTAGLQVQNGVIQQIRTLSGPRRLPEVNQKLCRYNASYQVRLHP